TDQRIETAVPARGLSGGPGCGETADGCVFEGLRKVADREPLRPKQGFGFGTAQTRAEARSQGPLVDLAGSEVDQVQADDSFECAFQWCDATDDAGASTERYDGDPEPGAGFQQRLNGFGAGRDN